MRKIGTCIIEQARHDFVETDPSSRRPLELARLRASAASIRLESHLGEIPCGGLPWGDIIKKRCYTQKKNKK